MSKIKENAVKEICILETQEVKNLDWIIGELQNSQGSTALHKTLFNNAVKEICILEAQIEDLQDAYNTANTQTIINNLVKGSDKMAVKLESALVFKDELMAENIKYHNRIDSLTENLCIATNTIKGLNSKILHLDAEIIKLLDEKLHIDTINKENNNEM